MNALHAAAPPLPRPWRASSLPLKLFDTIPPGFLVHAAGDDRNAPLIHAGEIVVVDSDGGTGVIPEEGGLYLIEHVSPPAHRYARERRWREIVQVYQGKRGGWYTGPMRRGVGERVIFCADGPYRDELQIAEKLLGRLVGIVNVASVTSTAEVVS